MESVNSYHTHLENLRRKAEILTQTGRYLVTAFDLTDELVHREDYASLLRALRDGVIQELKKVKSREDSASLSHSNINHIVSISGSAFDIASKVLNSKDLSTISNAVGTVSQKKLPFGDFLVSIGPGGLPDYVSVVAVSQLARDSKQAEDQVKEKLRQNGLLLLNERAFLVLINRLIKDVLDGRLYLPVSKEKLLEIAKLNNRRSTSYTVQMAYTVSPVGSGNVPVKNDDKHQLG